MPGRNKGREPEMTRTFIAVELSEEAHRHLRNEIRRLAQTLPRLRWVEPASLHLTLAFLDELDDGQLKTASQIALEVAQTTKSFTLTIGTLGIFGPAYSPRVIWAGVDGHLQRLVDLQSRLATRLASSGFPPDDRPYSPHLTLARIKERLTDQELIVLRRLIPTSPTARAKQSASSPLNDASTPNIPVEHLSVMKSELLRTGPRYTRLLLCPFETI